MKENELIGTLLHILPEMQEIANNIREKYNIPEIIAGTNRAAELILIEPEVDWSVVEADINTQVRQHPNVLPDHLKPFLMFKDAQNWPDEPEIYETISEDFKNKVTFLYKFFVSTGRTFSMAGVMIDNCYDVIAKNLLRYIMTGEGSEVPQDWIGVVATTSMFGETTVLAMASGLTDPKWIAKEFKAELTKTFGKNRPRITKETLASAELYSLKRTGKRLRDIIDIDRERNPSNYSFDKKSKSYKPSIEKRKEVIKKRLQRFEQTLEQLIEDSS
jgi:hypothetical protein